MKHRGFLLTITLGIVFSLITGLGLTIAQSQVPAGTQEFIATVFPSRPVSTVFPEDPFGGGFRFAGVGGGKVVFTSFGNTLGNGGDAAVYDMATGQFSMLPEPSMFPPGTPSNPPKFHSAVLATDGTHYAGYIWDYNKLVTAGGFTCAEWTDGQAGPVLNLPAQSSIAPFFNSQSWCPALDSGVSVGTQYTEIETLSIPAGGDGSIPGVLIQQQNGFMGNGSPNLGGAFAQVRGAMGGEQVGTMSSVSKLGSVYDSSPASNPGSFAVVWHGSSQSMVNLGGGIQSAALATNGAQQGGWTISFHSLTGTHATIWSGTAASMVDLHPAGYFDTRVTGMSASFQVGDGWVGGPAWSPGATRHALLWKGSAASVVDLNQIIPNVQPYVTITGADMDGNIVGYMTATPDVFFNGVDQTRDRPFAGIGDESGIIISYNPALMLSSVSLSPANAAPGDVLSATVTLQAPALAGGLPVSFTSSNTALLPTPPSVVVPEGQTSVTFSVPTSAATFIDTPASVTLIANAGRNAKTTQLTLTPIPPSSVQSVTTNPSSVMGDYGFVGTITLDHPALVGGVTVNLSSSNQSLAFVPASITIPDGAASATFISATGATTIDTSATITASFNDSSASTNLTVTASNPIVSLALNSATAAPGDTVTGTATLAGPAPAGGQTLMLGSSNSLLASLPASLVIAAGQATGTFSLTINPSAALTGATTLTVFGQTGSVSRTISLTVAPVIKLVSVSASTGQSGQGTGTVTLNLPALVPTTITLTNTNSAVANMPASVTIPAGQQTANFTFTDLPTPVATSGTLTATFGSSVSTPISVIASPQPTVQSVSVTPVLSGKVFVVTITLSGPALLGSTPVLLTSGNPTLAPVGALILVPFGATSVQNSAIAGTVTSITNITMTASVNGVAGPTGTLTITPILALSLGPYSMIGPGTVTTATVTLGVPAPASSGAGIVVTLSSVLSAIKFPATVTIPVGQTSASFSVQGNGVSALNNDILTASFPANMVLESMAGGSANIMVTVAPTDKLLITRGTLTWSKSTQVLTFSATSSNPQSIISVLNGAGNAPLGTMTNLGAGNFTFQTKIASISSVNIKSNLGGSTGGGVAIIP